MTSSEQRGSAGSAGSAVFTDAFSARLAAELGQGVRAARCALHMRRIEVADWLGITVAYYARIERGHALPSVTMLAHLVDALALDVDQIIARAAGGALPRPAKPSDPLPVRRVLRRVRRATASARRLVAKLLDALDEEE